MGCLASKSESTLEDDTGLLKSETPPAEAVPVETAQVKTLSSIMSSPDDIFASIDVDGSGLIGSDELKQYLIKAQVDTDEMSHMFANLDTDKDGKISRSEWTAAVRYIGAGTLERAARAPEFEYSTPMLVMPLAHFKALGKIYKSTVAWRAEAFANGWLVEHKPGNTVSIFISHRWWHNPPGRPEGVYDWGGPDYVEGDKTNLKWELVCSAADALVDQHGLQAENVAIWMDWYRQKRF